MTADHDYTSTSSINLTTSTRTQLTATEEQFFSFTKLGWMIPASSASISILFSIIVISFIVRSKDLSSSYHRIMLFMSSWDVASSLAIALTTIPMPTDVHDVYPFAGRAFGNALTCTCQGLVLLVGWIYAIGSNCTLNIYYVCTIRYGISDETVNKWVLPITFAISTVNVCAFSYIFLSRELFNPRPFEPVCFVSPYPYNCITNDTVECIRGGDHDHDHDHGGEDMISVTFVVTVMVALIGFSFLFILASMILVIAAVFKTEISLRGQYGRENISLMNTRTALRQAMMYIGAFLLTWVWGAFLMIWVWLGIGVGPDDDDDYENSGSDASGSDKILTVINPMKLFFLPLQGFFNALIFLSNKASILRKANPNLTRLAALHQTIVSPLNVPQVLVSQIGAMENESLPSHSFHDLDNDNHDDGDDDNHDDDDGPQESIPSNSTPSLDYSRAIASSPDKIKENQTGAPPRLSKKFRKVIQPLEEGNKSKEVSSSSSLSSGRCRGDVNDSDLEDSLLDDTSQSKNVKLQRQGTLRTNDYT